MPFKKYQGRVETRSSPTVKSDRHKHADQAIGAAVSVSFDVGSALFTGGKGLGNAVPSCWSLYKNYNKYEVDTHELERRGEVDQQLRKKDIIKKFGVNVVAKGAGLGIQKGIERLAK